MAFHLNGYSNFHDDNQDWIVSKIKNIDDAEAHTEELAEAAQASADASQLSAEASQASANASQLSAEASQQSASDSQESAEASAASELSAKNYADHIADPVSGLVTTWLTDHITNPSNPPIDTSLSVAGAAADAKAAGDEITDLKSMIGKPDIVNLFEVGDIAMTTNGWTYGNNNVRVRTRQGVTLPMKAGTKIGLTDYTDASYFVGWRDENEQYSMRGWLSAEYETPVDGEYVILIKSNSSTVQINETDLASLFYGYPGEVYKGIEYNSNVLNEIQKVSYKTNSGYISSSGSITSPTAGVEVYTDKIPVDAGYVLDIELQYTEVRSAWAAYALYDSDGVFISRTVLRESSIPQFKAFVTISEPSAKYISFTYRTYNEAVFEIKCDKIIKILENEIKNIIDSSDKSIDSIFNRQIALMSIDACRGIAHRGYSQVAPENTAAAFIAASKAGFTTIETDVRFTSDNIPVLIHDATVDRTSNGTGNVVDKTLAQLKALDFGSWFGSEFAGQKILTLSEGVELCKKLGLKMLIENKTWEGATTVTLREAIANSINRYAYKDSVAIMYDAAGALANFATELPGVGLVLLQNDIDSEIATRINTLKQVTNKVYVAVNYTNITPEKIETVLSNNAKIYLWTVDDQQYVENMDMGISGVVSNSINAPVVLYQTTD